ncbi:lycopene cyclase family protein [Flavihumibacter rivuli]|uniref:lycopene cyclase family protein n=1 Tax=Flavihumibacter rivuli TaxID=2838156 RepID=UPI001BDEEAC8|nr:lycopene cyclase family protein [Flavihumibacter rivuli]ULQ56283.1 lycopene cyclase family protein [Flavihumibacter rivuli]
MTFQQEKEHPGHFAGGQPNMTHYDYLITGSGLAGLSLAYRMAISGKLDGKRILMVDSQQKQANDRTWCFWETGPGLFEEAVFRRWENCWFHGPGFSRQFNSHPYQYKMIRGADFYRFVLEELARHPNIEQRRAKVVSLNADEQLAYVTLSDGEQFTANYVFNSILWKQPEPSGNLHYLIQHFKGWVIHTPSPVFDPAANTFMDFRVAQGHGTTFVYVMPLAPDLALVEYTLFTQDLLEQEDYDKGLKEYISGFMGIKEYKVEEEEFGIIPMTNYRFRSHEGRIVHIGTAGGQTKASSGFTFQFVQKRTAGIVESLIQMGDPYSINHDHSRFHFYDSVLLDILARNTLPGAEIFTTLFKKNRIQDVFRFLDNETSLPQELKIISTLPTLPFLSAAIRQLKGTK